MPKETLTSTPLLTVDAALALLEGYESTYVDDLPPLADSPLSPARNDRFKRARERKKRELEFYRAQQHVAIRQEQERREAELLNAQLKRMVDALLKQSRQLQAMVLSPNGLGPLIHHKRLQQNKAWTEIAQAVEIHNLTIALDLLELMVDDTVTQFQNGSDRVVKIQPRDHGGCSVEVEAMDTRVLPYDLQTASQSMWQFLAFENGPLRIESTRDTATRVFSMEMANGSFRGAYKGTFLYRRRATADGNVVITWCSDWTPMEPFDHDDIAYFTHESFRREGFVRFIPSTSDPSCVTRLHMLYRFERPACGLDSCRRGVCGDVTVETADEAIRECVLWEVNQLFQGMENDIISRRRLLQLAIDSKSATSRTVTP